MPRLSPSWLCFIVCIFLNAPRAHAAWVVGGSGGLMTQNYADRLQDWLGEGEIKLTRIYAKSDTDNSVAFHAASDKKGRTITLIELVSTDQATGFSPSSPAGRLISVERQLVGGYNPKSWESNTFVHWTTNPLDKTAFLFNLSSNEKFFQRLNFAGDAQTFNYFAYGPTFGSGFDLLVDASLKNGYANAGSYGPDPLGGPNRSIVRTNELDEDSIYSVTGLSVGSLEVYTISNIAAVPEPATLLLWGIGSAGVISLRWRRAARNENA